MVKEIFSQLGKNPIEVLAGLLLVGLGVVLTAAGTDGSSPAYYLYAGSLGTAFGGVVLSWTVSKAVSKQEAIGEIGSQLGLVSKNLWQAAGQMSRVVDQCSDHSLPAETGFALIGQSASFVGAQVSAIQGIIGNPFEVGDLLSTISEMENLAESLDRRESRESVAGLAPDGAEVDELKSRLEGIRAEITGVSNRKGRVREDATCPNCGRTAPVNIGPHAGDTAASQCPHCRERFNAHRRWDGTVFSRPLGGGSIEPAGDTSNHSQHTIAVTHPCPKCESEVRVMTRAGESSHKFAVCLDCNASLIFDLKNGGVTSDGEFERHLSEPIGRMGSGGTGARPLIHCVTCERDLRAVISQNGSYFTIDNRCRRLYVVSHEAFREWREQHEPETIFDSGFAIM